MTTPIKRVWKSKDEAASQAEAAPGPLAGPAAAPTSGPTARATPVQPPAVSPDKLPPSKQPPLAFPELSVEEEDPDTRNMALHEMPLHYQIDRAREVVRAHHPRIASTLDSMWGYKECADYLEKLTFDGTDPTGHTRVGFKPEVLTALLRLQAMHVINYR